MKNRYSLILGNLGNTCDHFLPTGYKDVPPKHEMIRQATAIPDIEGIELVGSWDITETNTNEIKARLDDAALTCVSIIPDLFSQKRWGLGSLSAKSADTRRQALEECRTVSRIARQIGCPLINLWLGQDGYDYPLTADYRTQRAHLTENIRAIASEFPDLRYALEYKPREPRNFSFHARAADTLLMANETGLENVGVCIDVGHAFMAGENVAESAVMLQHYGKKLFHMHFNDNYRSWDDDMIVGSVHVVEYLELLHWLREISYAGWYSMDQYPIARTVPPPSVKAAPSCATSKPSSPTPAATISGNSLLLATPPPAPVICASCFSAMSENIHYRGTKARRQSLQSRQVIVLHPCRRTALCATNALPPPPPCARATRDGNPCHVAPFRGTLTGKPVLPAVVVWQATCRRAMLGRSP